MASRWPEQHRCSGMASSTHQTLAAVSDDEERWAAIKNPRVWLVRPGPQASERWAGVDD
ncbi:DUF6192 family protein [Streptomyces sp. NBC_01280]|nr:MULTISPECIES: DUF6192 family protein [Streptomyces]MCX5441161.1 DUF6192 family protein [Streptomyces sp. NBC_00063]WUB92541.1 DUF6192 family protein [Streptomyces sp. NBC_00569]